MIIYIDFNAGYKIKFLEWETVHIDLAQMTRQCLYIWQFDTEN